MCFPTQWAQFMNNGFGFGKLFGKREMIRKIKFEKELAESVGLRLLTTTASSFIFGIRLKPRYIFLSENVSIFFTQCDEFRIASNL